VTPIKDFVSRAGVVGALPVWARVRVMVIVMVMVRVRVRVRFRVRARVRVTVKVRVEVRVTWWVHCQFGLGDEVKGN
jgi:hypothetical protein